ncbi:MAG: beta-glucosidase [Phycisphaerae bacterium]|nr:beta-glucosidase [Phycisphaerae bacterium]
MEFSKGFKWGVSTSAYQIEGAALEDGKGLSIWDMKCRQPGLVFENQTGEITCDHYHRYKEDVKIMKDLGIQVYRMSISWPRVLPQGVGEINPKGVDFYNRLIDELLKHNIEPFITMFHWDYPQKLYEKGGWLNPDSSNWFAEYVRVLMDNYSDRVKNWITLNEPQAFVRWGHYELNDASGIKPAFSETLLAAHNVLLSHGKAVQTVRQYSKQDAIVGYAPVGDLYVPYDEDVATDVEAAKKETFSIKPLTVFNSIWWMDPIFNGNYPEEGRKLYGEDMPEYSDEDMKIISSPIDYLGLNMYSAKHVSQDKDGNVIEMPREPGHFYTHMDSPTEPKVLYWGSKWFYDRYKKPIIITENGMPNMDCVSADGCVHDPQRIEFLRRYLTSLKKACKEGVDVRGYFQWSFMDNFEWSHGFSKRFGLVYVDYTTRQRIIKDSGYWYKDVIRTNGKIL